MNNVSELLLIFVAPLTSEWCTLRKAISLRPSENLQIQRSMGKGLSSCSSYRGYIPNAPRRGAVRLYHHRCELTFHSLCYRYAEPSDEECPKAHTHCACS